MGLTAPDAWGVTPTPRDGRLRTVAEVDQLSFAKRKRSATNRGDVVLGGAGRIAGALVMAASRWVAPSTWRATANLVLWLVVCYFVLLITLAGLVVSLMTVPIGGIGVGIRASVLRLLAELVHVDRERIERLSRVRVQPLALPRTVVGASLLAREPGWAPWLWRLPAYQLICAPVVTGLAFCAVAWWWATIACFVLAATPQPDHQTVILHALTIGPPGWSLSPIGTAGLVLAGVGGVLWWPTALRAVSAIDVTVARRLLGPSTSELSREVVRLSEARAQAVAAADAERRRIERDLHDGFQPQLVNLALNLGLARAQFANDPDTARSLLDRAHNDAKRATEDLRNLVRGIHPSVLDERGLDAAFSALAASTSVPMQIDVHLDQRPPRQAEAIAYFVVAEAITNISKHAHACIAVITVHEADGTLRVLVQDDGQGGAQPEPGGGLAGLGARIAAVDGTFSLTSPEGGPTRLQASIPCGW